MLNDYTTGHIRTGVPILAGFLVGLAAKYGIDIDSAELVTGISTISAALYYGLVRAAAERWPATGILLGVNKAPAYTPPPDPEFA